jgi:curved DNA-binding protein CbpA
LDGEAEEPVNNYYDLLGVSRDATEAAIRDRFRVIARDLHPDRFQDPERKKAAEAKFQILTEAVNVLSNPARRKAHDFDLDKGKGTDGPDPQTIARVYLAKGVKAYKEGDFVQAVQNFDLSVQHWNKDAKALHYLALACLKVPGQARKGVDAIEMALKIEPLNGLFHREAGKLYLQVGLKSKAERHLEEALKWNPQDSEVSRHLAGLKPELEQKNLLGTFFGRKG